MMTSMQPLYSGMETVSRRKRSCTAALLVLCQVKQKQSYAYSTTSDVSQSVSQEKIDKFLFLRYRRSRVFLWLATADMASL